MPRKGPVRKRPIPPDPIYNNRLATRFIRGSQQEGASDLNADPPVFSHQMCVAPLPHTAGHAYDCWNLVGKLRAYSEPFWPLYRDRKKLLKRISSSLK